MNSVASARDFSGWVFVSFCALQIDESDRCLRAKRCSSKSGCDRAICMTASIAAIMTAGLIFFSVHSRNGSRKIGKLSMAGLSGIAESSSDFGEGCRSAILSNNRLQFRILKILVGCQKKTRDILPVRLARSPSRFAHGVELESDQAKNVRNTNLLSVQQLLV